MKDIAFILRLVTPPKNVLQCYFRWKCLPSQQIADSFFFINLRLNKNTNIIKMEEDTGLFCWQVPQLKKYRLSREKKGGGAEKGCVVLVRVHVNKHETVNSACSYSSLSSCCRMYTRVLSRNTNTYKDL